MKLQGAPEWKRRASTTALISSERVSGRFSWRAHLGTSVRLIYESGDRAPRRAFESERANQERNGERAPLLNARRPVLRGSSFIFVADAADFQPKDGGLGATLTDLEHIAELSVARSIEEPPATERP